MQKLIFCFIALFVLFFACKQNSKQELQQESKQQISTTTEELPVSTPIPPPQTPSQANDKPYKKIDQANAKDLVYPSEFTKWGIPQFKGATMENNIMLDGPQGQYGQRIRMNCKAEFNTVMDFYTKQLGKNDWTENENMKQSKEQDDIKFYSTNYEKDNRTLMLAITQLAPGNISVLQILKDN